MKKIWLHLPLIILILGLWFPADGKSIDYYMLYTSTGGTDLLPILKMLPTGEIIETGMAYTAGTGLISSLKHKNKLIVGNPYPRPVRTGIVVYDINSDGSLSVYSEYSTDLFGCQLINSGDEAFVVMHNPYWNPTTEIWSIDSLKHLEKKDTLSISALPLSLSPLNNIFVGTDVVDRVYVYTIDPMTYQLQLYQELTTSGIRDLVFNPDGTLVVGCGFDIGGSWGVNSKKVILFKVEADNTLSEVTSLIGNYYPWEAVMHPNGKYFYLYNEGNDDLRLFELDKEKMTIKDTGQEYYPEGNPFFYWGLGGEKLIQITPDGKFLICAYQPQAGSMALASALINSDGSLSWTGYSFLYSSNDFGGDSFIRDYEIVPHEVTGISETEWLELE
jgi:6-phosphogluconolactonase (cycloisomerase 2 family)